ncbi:hypothetical protein RvY_11879-2 [Ramazzottius varieornatus]|uniref:Uncharacterized protein n=1 Tax=Ramazzottius varieornatus TaxID=947166 RepID=A0A1D1VRD7_RAMVA|nr:hypothetical protein RvY_11879-2 [Ramazzottius varieornatus]
MHTARSLEAASFYSNIIPTMLFSLDQGNEPAMDRFYKRDLTRFVAAASTLVPVLLLPFVGDEEVREKSGDCSIGKKHTIGNYQIAHIYTVHTLF